MFGFFVSTSHPFNSSQLFTIIILFFINLEVSDYIGGTRKTAFLSGVINAGLLGQHRVVVFKNELKEKDNEPDYHILLSDPAKLQDDEPPVPYGEFSV